ncbi:phage portal protein [Dielma fastidiosa]|uniref:HK97 family phage portal protein n=1 Tax=Dielma fastidiosa TaxID=1034346 RepID=A0A318KPQ2_9FIRM|nr:phage portal protein [Dielma fastidiosa]PXX79739.1 HK97 family phage portal protein [Dielma fastidiosa]
MGLFNRIAEFFNKSETVTRFEMVTSNGNGFYAWNGKMYQSDLIRACIRPKTKAVGKALAKHIRTDANGDIKVNPEPYIKMLLKYPNPYMTFQQMVEKVMNQYQLNNNAFIYINRDSNNYPTELYPIPAINCEALYDSHGYLYLRCMMMNGKTVTYPYTDIIHLKNDYNNNDIFGDSPIEVLKPLMEIVTTTDQGIVKAIKNSGIIKWLLKFNNSLRPDDIKRNTKQFVDDYLSFETDAMGAAGIDNKVEAIQIDPKDYVPNAAQMDRTINRLYSFFNINEKIIQNKFTEDEWTAYYEGCIEADLIQLSQTFTRRLFTRREIGTGNEIVFEASNLQYASMSTKLNMVQMVDRGAMTPNEWRAVLGMTPTEGGDKPIRRLDTQVVKEGGE